MKVTEGTRARVVLDYTRLGAATDPSTATARVQRPDGTVTNEATSPASPPATGRRVVDITFDQPGTWRIMGIGTGAVVATAVVLVQVEPGIAAP